jgi:hypothetical protein
MKFWENLRGYYIHVFSLLNELYLQVFDKSGCGYICASDIRAILQCLGEDLTEEESKAFHGFVHNEYYISFCNY